MKLLENPASVWACRTRRHALRLVDGPGSQWSEEI